MLLFDDHKRAWVKEDRASFAAFGIGVDNVIACSRLGLGVQGQGAWDAARQDIRVRVKKKLHPQVFQFFPGQITDIAVGVSLPSDRAVVALQAV